MKFSINSFLILFFISCAAPPEVMNRAKVGQFLNNKMMGGYEATFTIPVLFSTLRKTNAASPLACSNAYYTTEHDKDEKYGVCWVSVPAQHDIGGVDIIPDVKLDKTYKFQAHQTYDKNGFLDQINVDKSGDILVFVHGFNVPFEEAVLRASQIKYDLKFSGPVVLFSWASGAEDSVIKNLKLKSTYTSNQESAKNSISQFANFIDTISKTNKSIYLIVHSMGHQIVLPAISSIQTNNKIIEELILNAPDFDSVEFKNISSNLKKISKRVTVYCSPGDNALTASSQVNKGKRIGSCEKVDGIDMINVNSIDSPFMGVGGLGHGYYSSRPVLTDLYQVLLGLDVSKRLFIRKSEEPTEDYVLRK